MNYPVWYVLYLTAPMLIPLIAVSAAKGQFGASNSLVHFNQG